MLVAAFEGERGDWTAVVRDGTGTTVWACEHHHDDPWDTQECAEEARDRLEAERASG